MANDTFGNEYRQGGSICNFIPPKSQELALEPVTFVYETEINKLRQPFMNYLYCFNIVVSGTASLNINGRSYPLSSGVGFFAFPHVEYTITDYDDFKYVYISFVGAEAQAILEDMGVRADNCVIDGLDDVRERFMNAVGRVNQGNATLLTESMLLYVLATVRDVKCAAASSGERSLYNQIISYVDVHYSDADLSLSKIGEVFSYSEKYVSTLIKKNMSIGFSLYLNRLRIEKAKLLMRGSVASIREISESCGFSDPLYFSKVFKKHTKKTPSEYIRLRRVVEE
ncbi:MAG: helix-turn-helix transcriptional regulator [Clostridia bacterium]|nr:helix-turn-helix transcriptional regulator [Clostridia bacterium]